MTLGESIPSVARIGQGRLSGRVWPIGTVHGENGDILVGGVSLTKTAANFGTPVLIIDEADFRARCRQYRRTIPEMEICYAGRVLLTGPVASWCEREGLSLAVWSAGELAFARSADFPGERVTFHGGAQTAEDLKAAIEYGGCRVVLGSFDEIEQVASTAPYGQPVLLRVGPGADPGVALEKVARVLARQGLRLVGLHCHLGTRVLRVAAYEEAVRRMLGLLARIRDRHGIVLGLLNLGGGHAVPYRAEDPEFDLGGFAGRVRAALGYECERYRLPRPQVAVEPGRALVTRAGVTLYRVVAVRESAGATFVTVDGETSDNARLGTARLIGRHPRPVLREVAVVGRHAADDAPVKVVLPLDVRGGDLMAMACTGASLPPFTIVHNGRSRPIVIRRTRGC